MLSKKQKEDLLYSQSSFYRDFLPVDNHLLKLYDIYAKTIDYAWNVFREAGDSQTISTTRTLSTIPYFRVNIDDAMYDLNMARIVQRLSFEEQINLLNKEGKFASFVFNDKDAAGDPAVYSMRLFVNFVDKEPLRLYEDYFLRSNRLYLLPNYIQKKKKSVHYLHAYDLKINDYTLEKVFGTQFSLEAGPLLPRYEYRDVIEAYMRSFKGQMTIRSLRESIQLATKWERFRLEDRKSPGISERKLKLYDDWIISPNKFLVSLPEELIPDKIKINILRALMSEIKEADKDYMIFFDIEREDDYVFPMNRYPTIRYPFGEKMTPEDESSVQMVSMRMVEYPLDVAGRYDTTFFYNFNLRYDDPPANEIIGLLQKPRTFRDRIPIGDEVQVTYIASPRIPREFTVKKDAATGNIRFSLSSNKDETTKFELYHASTERGDYELVEVMDNDPSASIQTFEHSAKDSAKRYYKSRAVGENRESFFTLPINVDAV